MPVRVNIAVEGLDDVERLLKQLPTRVENKVNKAATLSAARVIAKRQKQEAPQDTGELRKAIRARSVKSRIPGRAVSLAGVQGKLAPLARLIEAGAGIHKIKPKRGRLLSFITNFRRVYARSVEHPGFAPNPFITRGGDNAKQNAALKFRDTMLRGIVREANKLSARSAKV